MTNTRLTDPEILEWRYPVVLESFGVNRGSGGAGRWRGGDGTVRRIRFLEEMELTVLSHHRHHRPLRPGRRRVRPMRAQLGGARRWMRCTRWEDRTTVSVEPGDVFVLETPSGGGYGPPAELEGDAGEQ